MSIEQTAKGTRRNIAMLMMARQSKNLQMIEHIIENWNSILIAISQSTRPGLRLEQVVVQN